ncbi:Dehydrogenase/reductase SDR family member 13 [Strongyloides ratti]|uniref:Dehydrogenase/reductase SDR family member 13 n=1 Tax=Strongyloides ratti TaxID=34506 RepID=A0A090LEA6_STRRB|nr:Dehydrogenase/reductase SDR family member 13 [Strongyloides ratti]CEF68082.1 Dehydrogenase/reductase SDR family member 13 [Strongyloides ratti]
MKTALVTGANSGIGLETCRKLYLQGYKVILAVRNEEEGIKAKFLISLNENEERLIVRNCNLCDLVTIENLALSLKNDNILLDVIVCNAGHEYLLEKLLEMGIIKETRIVVVTSGFYKKIDKMFDINDISGNFLSKKQPNIYYSISKLANCLQVINFQEKLNVLAPQSVIVAVRPGFVRGTNLGRHTHFLLRLLATPIIYLVAKNVDQGTRTIIHCATCPKEDIESGCIYADNLKEEYTSIVSKENGEKLIEITQTLLNEQIKD